MQQTPIIYNLFPRHFKKIGDWSKKLAHIAALGCNWVYVNPFHETGFSGSLYAIKNYYKLNPLFLTKKNDPSDLSPLVLFVDECAKKKLAVMMDLVINHTAFDSVLVDEHPSWFKRDAAGKLVSPSAIDPANADSVTVWGDLASIDNQESSDKKALWRYWDTLIAFYQNLGIKGFRCDAAYQVSSDLWKFLITAACKRDPTTVFVAETLGCRLEEIEALKPAGFHFLFNSSKWWKFDEPWCLDQHEANRMIAPSISFAESHDTLRIALEAENNVNVVKARYAFASVFSAGILLTMGFEYGEHVKMEVVHGTPADVSEPVWDLSGWIKKIHALKLSLPVLGEEGTWVVLTLLTDPVVVLQKTSLQGELPCLVCINKEATQALLDLKTVAGLVWNVKNALRICSENPVSESCSGSLQINPGEIVLIV